MGVPTVVSATFDYPTKTLEIVWSEPVNVISYNGSWLSDDRGGRWNYDAMVSAEGAATAMNMYIDVPAGGEVLGTCYLPAGCVESVSTNSANAETLGQPVKFRPYVLWVKLDSDSAPTYADYYFDRIISDANPGGGTGTIAGGFGDYVYTGGTLTGFGTRKMRVPIQVDDPSADINAWYLYAGRVAGPDGATNLSGTGTWTTGPVPLSITADAEPPTSLTIEWDEAALYSADNDSFATSAGGVTKILRVAGPTAGAPGAEWTWPLDFATNSGLPATVDFGSGAAYGSPGGAYPNPPIIGFPYTVASSGLSAADVQHMNNTIALILDID